MHKRLTIAGVTLSLMLVLLAGRPVAAHDSHTGLAITFGYYQRPSYPHYGDRYAYPYRQRNGYRHSYRYYYDYPAYGYPHLDYYRNYRPYWYPRRALRHRHHDHD